MSDQDQLRLLKDEFDGLMLRFIELALQQCKVELIHRYGTEPILCVLPNSILKTWHGRKRQTDRSRTNAEFFHTLTGYLAANGILEEASDSPQVISDALVKRNSHSEKDLVALALEMAKLLVRIREVISLSPEQAEKHRTELLAIERDWTNFLATLQDRRLFILDRSIMDDIYESALKNKRIAEPAKILNERAKILNIFDQAVKEIKEGG